MDKLTGTKRDISLDFIKVLACFGVVVLHTINRTSGPANSIFYYFGTISIPLFFAVNGALMLNKSSINLSYCLQKIKVILAVSLFWTTVYSIVVTIINGRGVMDTLIDIFGGFMEFGSYDIFWFYGALIIIYLLLPVLHSLFKSQLKLLPLIVFLGGCLVSHYLTVKQSVSGEYMSLQGMIQTYRLWIYLCYFYLGGIIYSHKPVNRKIKFPLFLIICILICTGVTAYGYFIGSNILSNSLAEFLYDSPVVIGMVSLLLWAAVRTDIHYDFISKISATTMGIYIIHYTIVYKLLVLTGVKSSLIFLFFPVIIFIVSCLICTLILKKRFLKRLISL